MSRKASKTQPLFDGDTFEHKGYTFKVTYRHDDHSGPPWEECDGHGIVSEWTSRRKRAGERILVEDRSHKRYYDIKQSIARALKEQWDADPLHAAFPDETKRQQAARAVEADFEYLRQWCHDQWEYVGVIVTLEDDPDITASLWGVETFNDYHMEVARELAEELYSEKIEVEKPDVVLGEN